MFHGNLLLQKKIIFFQIIGIGLGFLAVSFWLIFTLYPLFASVWSAIVNKIDALCGCANHWSFANHPYIFSGLIFLGLVLVAFLVFAMLKLFKLKQATNKFIGINLKDKKRVLSHKLQEAIKSLGLKNQVIEIKSPEPVVFCYGLLKPKICISRALVRKLDRLELQAVLMHEQYHMRHFEPLKIFLAELLTKILFFLPGLKIIKKKYLAITELLADEQATNGFANRAPLMQALSKIIGLKEQMVLSGALAIPFFSVTEERLNRLTDENYRPKFKIFSYQMLFSVVALFSVLIALGLFLSSIKPAIASHQNGACSHEKNSSGAYCQMPPPASACMAQKIIKESACNLNNFGTCYVERKQ